jgi:heme exporter protein CcmD
MKSPEFYLWWSYGVTFAALVAEMVALRIGRSRATRRVEEERDLEAQD